MAAFLILRCEFSDRYVAALSVCKLPDVVATADTLPEALAKADELNAAADVSQHDRRAA